MIRWPRGVRGRLILIYTSGAVVLAAIGGLLFTHQLANGVQGNLDTLLADRATELASTLSADPTAGLVDVQAHLSPRTETVTELYRPDGRLAQSDPADLPDSLALSSARRADAAAGRAQILTAEADGVRLRLRAVSVTRSGASDPALNGTWVLVVGGSLSQADDAVGDLRQALLIATPLALLAVALGTWLLSGAALAPVERMRREAAALSREPGQDGAADRALTVPDTGDELQALGTTLNELLDRLHNSLAIQRESLRRQQDFVADAGHELRTPLAVLRTELELADRPHRTRDDLIDSVRHAATEVDRLIALSNSLLALARVDAAAAEPATRRLAPQDIAPVLADALRAWRAEASARDVTLGGEWPDAVTARIPDEALRQVLDNLLSNAVRHTPHSGTIDLIAGQTADGICRITVTDSGPGMAPDFLPHAFERFRRADAARARGTDVEPAAGAGLGLAIVAAIVATAGGEVSAENREPHGTRITVTLPGHHS
jgi:two-component system OmpR family sensor kinase